MVAAPLYPAMTTPDAVPKASPNAMTTTNSRRSSPPAAVDTSKSPLLEDASEGTDPGYASIADVPEGTPENSRDGFNSEILLPPLSLFKRKVTKLSVVDKPIALQTMNRFNDLNELFGKELYNYLANTNIKYSAVSIKLKVFGEDENTAKPGIVVLCDKVVMKRVRRFFNQPQVKLEYQPCDASLCLPSFEIVVCDRPPKLMSSATNANLYGDPLWYDEKGRVATLDGIVIITSMEGNVMLLGMTVGHIFREERPNEDDLDLEEKNNKFDNDEEWFFDEVESFKLDLPLEEVQVLSQPNFAGDTQDIEGYPTQSNMLWSNIGNVVEVSRDNLGNQADLDWALIRFADPLHYHPNLIGKSPIDACEEPMESEQSQPVLLVGGTKGLKIGLLSMSKSFLMLASGGGFVATYALLIQGQVLEPGDCGSWVFNRFTNEVYGHVVGSDVFGEFHVIPLQSTFAQMKECFAASSVCLPTELEARAWLSLQAEARAETLPLFSFSESSSQSETKTFRKVNYEEMKARALSLAEVPFSALSTATDLDEMCNWAPTKISMDENDSGYASLNTSPQPW
ncbi:hypothetical protein MMC17_002703 [Xylographa soralifera]|nr:hypothetical protein [Xylographa soralifera]